MMLQRHLFPLPATPRRYQPTREQLALLDLLALRDGTPLGELTTGKRQTLRRLMLRGLVECVGLGPAVYVMTPMGRLVRGRR